MSADEDEDEEDENLEFLLTPWKESTIFQEFSAWLISTDGKSKATRETSRVYSTRKQSAFFRNELFV